MSQRPAPMAVEHEKLDIEDDETRARRIQHSLEKLASTTSSLPAEPPAFPKFDFGDRTTFAMNPPTELLSRIQAFLPQLEASNVLLAQQDPASVDIENVDDEMGTYIEMNLGLGVYEDRSHAHHSEDDDTEMSSSSSSSSSPTSNSSSSSSSDSSSSLTSHKRQSDSDDDSDDSDSDNEIYTGFVLHRQVKPLPRRARAKPQIVVLDEGEGQAPAS